MGACCCSCITGGDGEGGSAAETELQQRHAEADKKTLAIARGMSSPTIDVEDRVKASGYGLALAAVSIEQDAAYWEIHVETLEESTPIEVMAGLATKKGKAFYKALEEAKDEEDAPETNGTALMGRITVSNGDVIGVVGQQADLPMIQFFLNGEAKHDQSITRFRGTVYPSIYLPAENEGLVLKFVFHESQFKQKPPSSWISPVIVARGLV